MNKNTKSALLAFIDQVETLAQGVIHLTGTVDCAKLLDSAEALKKALKTDKTIV